jgi:hypothetical protein
MTREVLRFWRGIVSWSVVRFGQERPASESRPYEEQSRNEEFVRGEGGLGGIRAVEPGRFQEVLRGGSTI